MHSHKNDKLVFIYIKNICSSKETIIKVNRKATDIWKDVCYIYMTKDLHPQDI